jgi:hypothetical protein
MSTTTTDLDANRLTILATLAGMLERLERSRQPVDAVQYRSVVDKLRDELAGLRPGPALSRLFQASPATAELYENLRYEHAGLCLRPLEAALAAESLARGAIERARRR